MFYRLKDCTGCLRGRGHAGVLGGREVCCGIVQQLLIAIAVRNVLGTLPL
jgi:hypothetical protein